MYMSGANDKNHKQTPWGRAWMVCASGAGALPAQAITYNHRSEAMYRAIEKEPQNPYVARALSTGLENVRMLSSKTLRPQLVWGRFFAICITPTMMAPGKHGFRYWMLRKTSCCSGNKNPPIQGLTQGIPSMTRCWRNSSSRNVKPNRFLGTNPWTTSRWQAFSTTTSTGFRSRSPFVLGAIATWILQTSRSTTGHFACLSCFSHFS